MGEVAWKLVCLGLSVATGTHEGSSPSNAIKRKGGVQILIGQWRATVIVAFCPLLWSVIGYIIKLIQIIINLKYSLTV